MRINKVQMKLTSVMLNEGSQTQKITYCVVPLRQNSSVVLKFKIVVTPGWEVMSGTQEGFLSIGNAVS